MARNRESLKSVQQWIERRSSRKVRNDKGQMKAKDKATMKLKPLQDRVIVKQSDAEEKTKSGILLPDAAKEKPTKGKVIAVGPGKLDDKGKAMELGVRVNDTVFYGKYSGTDVEVDGQKFVILRESDILGVLE
jgi:chaperonin GroES